MSFVYPAVFHKEGNAYWAEFPDLPGCQSYGETLHETMSFAQEALAGYLLTLLEDGRAVSPPSDPEILPRGENSFPALISCDIDPYRDSRAVKKTLTIPAWLNDRAVSMGLNFSQILQEALLTKVQNP